MNYPQGSHATPYGDLLCPLLSPTPGPSLGDRSAHLHAGHIDAGPHLELGTHLEDTGYTVQEHVVELGGHGGDMGSSSGPFM